MQDVPLTIDLIARRALQVGGDLEVVSVEPAGIDRHSWADVAERVLRLSTVLEELGVARGARVGTFAWNGHRHLELYFAVPCSGRVLHAANVRLHPDQVEYAIRHAGDEILFVDASLTGTLAPLRDRLSVREIVVMATAPRWTRPSPTARSTRTCWRQPSRPATSPRSPKTTLLRSASRAGRRAIRRQLSTRIARSSCTRWAR